MTTLSVIIICKNEEDNIHACLESIKFVDEIIDQKWDILTAAGQWRKIDLDNVETEEQIFPEFFLGN